jgi:hypothetical protein
MDWIQSQVVSGFSIIVLLVVFFLAIWAGMAVGRKNKILGWVVGIGVLFLAIGLFGPVMEALDDKACDLNSGKCEP